MPERLRTTLVHLKMPNGEFGVYNSFDIVGDIAIVRMPFSSEEVSKVLGQAILNRHKNVKTVLSQISGVSGDHRLRKLVCIAGENKTVTLHKESKCNFIVDLETCYFSPRLLHERMRIAELTQPNETIVNMFAGVGCFSIIIANRIPTAKIFSIDINPSAFKFMNENVRINNAFGKVIPILGDAKAIIPDKLLGVAHRVLMPLPEKAIEYLPWALSSLKKSGGIIHCHVFEHASKTEDPKQKAIDEIEKKLTVLGSNFEILLSREVRKVGPNWYHIVVDVKIKG